MAGAWDVRTEVGGGKVEGNRLVVHWGPSTEGGRARRAVGASSSWGPGEPWRDGSRGYGRK